MLTATIALCLLVLALGCLTGYLVCLRDELVLENRSLQLANERTTHALEVAQRRCQTLDIVLAAQDGRQETKLSALLPRMRVAQVHKHASVDAAIAELEEAGLMICAEHEPQGAPGPTWIIVLARSA